MEGSKRVASYRERAQSLGKAAKSLPPEEKTTALRHQKALQDLADIEEWIAVAPRPAGTKHDYNLTPRIHDDLASSVFKRRGRAVKPRGQSEAAPAPQAEGGPALAAPNCPNCNFAMTLVGCDGMANVSLPTGSVFECRSCGIMVTPT